MSFVEKIIIMIGAAIVAAYLPSFFEIDDSANKQPVKRAYKIFNHIITITRLEGDDEQKPNQQ